MALSLQEFQAERLRANERILSGDDRVIKRFFRLDGEAVHHVAVVAFCPEVCLTFRFDQLRGTSRESARKRAVWSRKGLFHRRGERQVRHVRRRGGWNVFPRRDRRDDARYPG